MQTDTLLSLLEVLIYSSGTLTSEAILFINYILFIALKCIFYVQQVRVIFLEILGNTTRFMKEKLKKK